MAVGGEHLRIGEKVTYSHRMLICPRIRRAKGRILKMLARLEAGQMVARPKPSRGSTGTRAAGVPTRVTGSEKLPRIEANLPRGLAWLLPLVPCEAANFAAEFRLILADREMRALLAASRQARLHMAPLSRLLGIEVEVLAPTPAEEVVADAGGGLAGGGSSGPPV